jgi:hypothetical protein
MTSENADMVPVWMNIAAQVATGNRRMVLENGPDKMNSDDDDALEDVKPDEEKGMYTAEMDPRNGPIKLTQAQVAFQMAAGQALKAMKLPPRSQSPVGGSSDVSEPEKPVYLFNPFVPRSVTPTGSAPAAPPPRSSTPVSKESPVLPIRKADVPPRPVTPTINVPSDTLPNLQKGKSSGKRGGKKSTSKASRAGGLRPGVGGSGQTDTCVAQGNPSKP